MNPLDMQVEALKMMLERAGGVVHIDRDAPDHVKRAWLRMVMECRECREAVGGHKARGN